MKIGILKKYLSLCLLFGLLMGIIFRLVTPFFVQFLSETLSHLFTALCLSAGLLVGLFSYFIGKQSLLKTILEIGKFSTKLAKGDFSSNLKIESQDEVGLFADHYNDLILQLKKSLAGIQNLSIEINKTMYEQNIAANDLVKNTSELAENYEILQQETLKNAKDLDYSVSHFKILQYSMESLMKKIKSLSGAIFNLKDISNVSIQEMTQYEKKFDIIYNSLSYLKKNMDSISASSERIAQTINNVQTISDKINLLSLNAAIESARAGEQGAGFAVVSEEISKLASQTRQSLKEIHNLFKVNLEEVKKGNIAFSENFENIGHMISDSKQIISNFKSFEIEMNQQIENQMKVSNEADESIEVSNTIETNLLNFQHSFEKMKTVIQDMNRIGMFNAASTEELSASFNFINGFTNELEQNVKYYKF
jgi:methyl-accepting chemotaxis protein